MLSILFCHAKKNEALSYKQVMFCGILISSSLIGTSIFSTCHLIKGGEIRDTKTLNLSRNIVAFQVFGRCFSFFTLRDQLGAQQKCLLRVEEMHHADWLICLVGIQDGGITS